MVRQAAFMLTIVFLVVNFFQPAVTIFPHRGAEVTAPWPMQVAHAGIRSAALTRDDLERWVVFAILGFLFARVAYNVERTMEVINEIFRPWGDR